jgi:hypothetical protein
MLIRGVQWFFDSRTEASLLENGDDWGEECQKLE